jgi:hypothetical protein
MGREKQTADIVRSMITLDDVEAAIVGGGQ